MFASEINERSAALHRQRQKIDETLRLPLPATSDEGVTSGVRIPHDVRERLLLIQDAHGVATFREAVYRAMLVGLDAMEAVTPKPKKNGHRVLSENEVNRLRHEGFGAPKNNGGRGSAIAALSIVGAPKPIAHTERGQPVYVLDRAIPVDIMPKGRGRRGIGTPEPKGGFALWLLDLYGQDTCVIVKHGRHSRIFKIGINGDVFPISARSIEVEARKRLVGMGLLNKW